MFLPFLMPAAGLGIGSLGYGLFYLLNNQSFSAFGKAAVMVIFYLVITGGLHMDGLMDTADTYFSRRSKEKKLEIMKDPRVGAFAVMALVSLILLKTAFFYELFQMGTKAAIVLLFIPVLSRTAQAAVLCFFPYAKKDGIAVTFAQTAENRIRVIVMLIVYVSILTGLIFYLAGTNGLLIPFGLFLFTLFYYFSSKKNFGGITGDITGAYLELAEALMVGLLVLI